MRDSYMKLRLFCPVISMLLAVLSASLSASTVVYWTFEDGVPGELMNGTWTTNQVGSYDQSDNHFDFYAWNQANSPSFSAEGDTATGEGMAAVFSGNKDGYNGNSDFVNWSPSAWTIELSFRFDIVGVNRTLIGKDGSAGLSSNRALSAFYLQTGSASEIMLQYVSVSGERFILSTEFVPVAGKWYDLAVRSDGRYLDILINELEGDGLETIGSWDLDNVANSLGDVDHNIKVTSTWTFGRGWYGNSNVDHITGALDDIRFSDERLADEQLLSYRPLVVSQTEGKTILFKNIPEESDSFSVVLDREPSADVEVVLNIPVGLDAGNGNGQAVTRTFTAANWNVPFAVELSVADGDQLVNAMEKITYSVSSADVAFNIITATA
ncbi:MAG: LamG domain-containing protein, partial [Dehalococcoidales bacterium]|nr:LamG domain-containing protein [Dehalococcoidales bacterium]